MRDDANGLRFGLTVTKKVGHATERNRIRRRLRQAFRHAAVDHGGRNADVVVIGRRPALAAAFPLLVGDLQRALAIVTRPRPAKAGDSAGRHPFHRTQPMREDNKNLLLAIVLSVVVLIGWNYFYGVPQMQQQKQAQQTQQTAPAQPAQTPIPGAAPKERRAGGAGSGHRSHPSGHAGRRDPRGGAASAARGSRSTPRALPDRSICAAGASTTCSLKNYHETVDPKSPQHRAVLAARAARTPITPSSAGSASGPGEALPGPETLWTADAARR